MGGKQDSLLILITEQIEDYKRLSGEMDAQEKALADGNVETLIEILRRKNTYVEAIGRRDKEMRELADQGVSVSPKAKEKLAELKKAAAGLLEREEKSLVKLNTLRSVAGKEAIDRTKVRKAAEVYGSSPKKTEPRFLDKNE
jgi:hypothetical protein